MVVKLELPFNGGNRIVLSGPLEEIKKLTLVVIADEGKVANIALDDALLVNDTIYQISKPVYHERDKLRITVEKLTQDACACCAEEPEVILTPVERGRCGSTACELCYPPA